MLLFASECSSFVYLLLIFLLFDRLFNAAGPVISLMVILLLLVAMNAFPAMVSAGAAPQLVRFFIPEGPP